MCFLTSILFFCPIAHSELQHSIWLACLPGRFSFSFCSGDEARAISPWTFQANPVGEPPPPTPPQSLYSFFYFHLLLRKWRLKWLSHTELEFNPRSVWLKAQDFYHLWRNDQHGIRCSKESKRLTGQTLTQRELFFCSFRILTQHDQLLPQPSPGNLLWGESTPGEACWGSKLSLSLHIGRKASRRVRP